MKLSTFSKISTALLLSLLLTSCLIVRKNTSTPVANVNAQAATNTSWDQQEIGGLISNTSYHFRFSTPAAMVKTSETPEVSTYTKDKKIVLTVTSFVGTKEKVKQTIVKDFPSMPSVSTSTEKPWDVYTTGGLQNQVLAFADGTNGVIMSFQDVPDNIIKAIQDSFEFTSPSLKLTPFTNTKYKYSVSYPINYQLFATNDDRSAPEVSNVVHLSINPDFGEITIETQTLKTGQTFQDFYRDYFMLNAANAAVEQITIHGLKAYVRNDVMFMQRLGVIDAKGKVFIFTYMDNNRSEDIVQAFDTMMKSFKLL
jgi:hypothetical protein